MKPLYEEIRKYIFLFQIFGLCPFGRNDFQNFILGLYSLLLFVALVVLSLVAVFYNKIIDDDNSLSAMVAGLVFLGERSTHVILILQAFVSRFDFKKMLTIIGDIDEIFQVQLNRPVDYRTLKKKYFLKLTIILLISKGLLISLLIFLVLGTRKESCIFWLHLSFSIAAINVRCVQNIFFVDLLNERLEFLNQRLLQISQRNAKKSKLILYVESFDARSKRPSPMQDECKEMLALKEIYGMIWNASSLLNDCFGWSILAIVTRSFIGFTSHGYWLFLGFESFVDPEYIVDSAAIFVLYAFLLYLLCLSCYNCTGCVSIIYIRRVNETKRKFIIFIITDFPG